MSASDSLDRLRSAADGIIGDLAGRLDLDQVKSELADIERSARAARLQCEVASARELEADQRAAIEARLTALHGPRIDIRYRVEPAILGGLVVRVGERYVDGSVGGRLARMHEALVGKS